MKISPEEIDKISNFIKGKIFLKEEKCVDFQISVKKISSGRYFVAYFHYYGRENRNGITAEMGTKFVKEEGGDFYALGDMEITASFRGTENISFVTEKQIPQNFHDSRKERHIL